MLVRTCLALEKTDAMSGPPWPGVNSLDVPPFEDAFVYGVKLVDSSKLGVGFRDESNGKGLFLMGEIALKSCSYPTSARRQVSWWRMFQKKALLLIGIAV